MNDLETNKKKIIYKASHRGSKEMDLLLGSFVKKHINGFNENELNDLNKLLFMEDDMLYKWYFEKNVHQDIPKTKVSVLLRNFKF